MRDGLGRAGRVLALATLALVVVIAFLPGRTAIAIRVYALVLCGLVLLLVVGALRSAYPPARPLRAKPRQAKTPVRPPTLARLEREAALGVDGSFALHYRLRPRLRALAVVRLATRRGISLDDEPEAAREALGPLTWELVQRDRPDPENRLADGIPVSALAEVVDSLERL